MRSQTSIAQCGEGEGTCRHPFLPGLAHHSLVQALHHHHHLHHHSLVRRVGQGILHSHPPRPPSTAILAASQHSHPPPCNAFLLVSVAFTELDVQGAWHSSGTQSEKIGQWRPQPTDGAATAWPGHGGAAGCRASRGVRHLQSMCGTYKAGHMQHSAMAERWGWRCALVPANIPNITQPMAQMSTFLPSYS